MPSTISRTPKGPRSTPGCVKTSLSFTKPVYDFAAEQVQRRGFSCMSRYVDFLIRKDQEPVGTRQ